MIRRPPRSTLFPTRRSSDLHKIAGDGLNAASLKSVPHADLAVACDTEDALVGCSVARQPRERRDRKSTRLNSSHMSISYAVFCLKKKKARHQGDLRERGADC